MLAAMVVAFTRERKAHEGSLLLAALARRRASGAKVGEEGEKPSVGGTDLLLRVRLLLLLLLLAHAAGKKGLSKMGEEKVNRVLSRRGLC